LGRFWERLAGSTAIPFQLRNFSGLSRNASRRFLAKSSQHRGRMAAHLFVNLGTLSRLASIDREVGALIVGEDALERRTAKRGPICIGRSFRRRLWSGAGFVGLATAVNRCRWRRS